MRRASCSSTGPTIAPEDHRARRCCVGWDRSAARWSVCCCAAPNAAIPIAARHVPGVVRASPVAVDIRAHEGIEPTNNAGERSLRHAVIWRKLSFGTQMRQRQPLRRDDADGDRNLPPAASQRFVFLTTRSKLISPTNLPLHCSPGCERLHMVQFCCKTLLGHGGVPNTTSKAHGAVRESR